MWIIAPIVVLLVILGFIIAFIVSQKKSKPSKQDKKEADNNNLKYDDSASLPKHQVSRRHAPFFTPPNDQAGIEGERYVVSRLKELLENDEYILEGVLLPLYNGRKTELDCILITHKGIFCVEIKNWIGRISGDDESEFWLQEYRDYYMENRKQRNPVSQNEKHCEILEDFLDKKFFVDNVVIFPSLEEGSNIDSDFVFTIGEFEEYYSTLENDEDFEGPLHFLFTKLSPYVASEEELREHKEYMQKKFKD